MWSYGNSTRGFQLPGPDAVRHLRAGGDRRPAQHPARGDLHRLPRADRREGQRQPGPAAARPGRLADVAWSRAPPPTTGSVTYTFTAGSPGTYLYESGTDVDKQVQMGLYGALVVRPAGHPSQVNDRADSAFNGANEYVFLLSEVDPDLHLAVERQRAARLGRVQRAVLHDQRPQHAGHARPEQRLVAPHAAVRRAGAHQAVRRGDQPAPGGDPLPQRRDGQLPLPPARQRRARRQQGRPGAPGPGRPGPRLPEVRHRRPAGADGRRPDGLA